MTTGNYILYHRVSTQKQGKSGLGLAAQQQAIQTYLNDGRWKVMGEYVEVESGRRNDRPELAKALRACRVHNATLLIAKLDRLSRNVHFLTGLMESGVKFKAVDMPEADNFTVSILAALAQKEAELTSQRTKAALQAAKNRGVRLGKPANLTKSGGIKGAEMSAVIRAGKANARAADLREPVLNLVERGLSLQAIANELNGLGIRTVQGCEWKPMSVKRLIDRLN